MRGSESECKQVRERKRKGAGGSGREKERAKAQEVEEQELIAMVEYRQVQTLTCQLGGRPTEMRQVFSFFLLLSLVFFKSPLLYQPRDRQQKFDRYAYI